MTFDEAHRLIKAGDIIALRRELNDGASPNLANKFSWTLLMLAASMGNVGIGELLVSGGADVNRANNFGETALSLAAHFGHISFMKLLLLKGASEHCRPHGHTLADWLTAASSLDKDTLASVLRLVGG